MPLIGKLSDVYGHRTVYVSAMLLFAVGSVLCAIANDLWPLVAYRVIQAVGGGAVIPVTIAMIGHLFPPGRRAPALGLLGASAEFGGVIGPMWGALLDHFLDWRWVFWINVPLVRRFHSAPAPPGARRNGPENLRRLPGRPVDHAQPGPVYPVHIPLARLPTPSRRRHRPFRRPRRRVSSGEKVGFLIHSYLRHCFAVLRSPAQTSPTSSSGSAL